jgi:hypothetical protein
MIKQKQFSFEMNCRCCIKKSNMASMGQRQLVLKNSNCRILRKTKERNLKPQLRGKLPGNGDHEGQSILFRRPRASEED